MDSRVIIIMGGGGESVAASPAVCFFSISAGWISLLDLEDGHRWARRQEVAPGGGKAV